MIAVIEEQSECVEAICKAQSISATINIKDNEGMTGMN